VTAGDFPGFEVYSDPDLEPDADEYGPDAEPDWEQHVADRERGRA
jgi:hypothetical protein